MNAPISDDELLLYHYREGLDAIERARVAAALIARPEIAQRLQSLLAELDAAAATRDAPVPAPTFERWHAALDRAHASEATLSRSAWSPLRWSALIGMSAAALIAAFLIGVHVANDYANPDTSIATNDATRYERGLRWHLASTQQQLAGLSETSGAERAALIDAVIAQNRIYALAAKRAGDQRLAGALRSFAPILEQLARGDASSNESAAELAQLNFELRVMQARRPT